MTYYGNSTYYNSDFSHFGVKGMKWGVRKNAKTDKSGQSHRRVASHTNVSNDKKQASKNKPLKESMRQKMSGIVESFKAGYNDGLAEIARQQQQFDFQNTMFNNFVQQESIRNAINAGNMAMSLGASGGTNPYMFGMM